jgi:hypothetical protein
MADIKTDDGGNQGPQDVDEFLKDLQGGGPYPITPFPVGPTAERLAICFYPMFTWHQRQPIAHLNDPHYPYRGIACFDDNGACEALAKAERARILGAAPPGTQREPGVAVIRSLIDGGPRGRFAIVAIRTAPGNSTHNDPQVLLDRAVAHSPGRFELVTNSAPPAPYASSHLGSFSEGSYTLSGGRIVNDPGNFDPKDGDDLLQNMGNGNPPLPLAATVAEFAVVIRYIRPHDTGQKHLLYHGNRMNPYRGRHGDWSAQDQIVGYPEGLRYAEELAEAEFRRYHSTDPNKPPKTSGARMIKRTFQDGRVRGAVVAIVPNPANTVPIKTLADVDAAFDNLEQRGVDGFGTADF